MARRYVTVQEEVEQFFAEHVRPGYMPDFEVPPRVLRYLIRAYKSAGVPIELLT